MRFSCPPLPGFSDDARTPRVAPGANLRSPLPGLRKTLFGVLVLMGVCLSARAESLTPAKPAPGSVQVMFLPPPLEAGAVYSVGVYDAKTGRLVRRLHEDAEEDAFTAALNGFITFWDRKNDDGKTVPAGKYAGRGWAVGEMGVEGVDILGNDWAAKDEGLRIQRIEAIRTVPEDDGLAVLATMTDGGMELLRFAGGDGAELVWRVKPKPENNLLAPPSQWFLEDMGGLIVGRNYGDPPHDYGGYTYAWKDGSWSGCIVGKGKFLDSLSTRGRDHTTWSVRNGRLVQTTVDSVVARALDSEPEQPEPRALSASTSRDRLYLLEESPGWQRVRGLEWSDTKPDAAGHPVSEWRTFFERSIRRPDPTLGLDEKAPSPVVELPLAKNPLEPGKPQSAKLRAGFDAKGSYLETADGLRLLPVSTRLNLRAARLTRDPKAPDRLLFYQYDGAAWDVFSLTGVPKALVSFDAGEFELTADGERHPPPPTEEPPGP